MIPAPLSRANAQLRGNAFKVYAFLLEHCDTVDWRPMKVEVVMLGCRIEKMTAVDALRTLVHKGYVSRRGGGPRAYEYRVLPPPMPVVKPRAA